MTLFLLNIILAFLWGAAAGSFSAGTLILGFLVGYLALLLARPLLGPNAYYVQLWRAFSYVVWFVYELFKSSFIVAADVLTPGHRMKPAVVAFPLSLKTDAAITVLANTITLTPGTLSLDVSEDRSTLFVHSMYGGDDLDGIRDGLRDFERHVQILMEPEETAPPED